MESSDGKEREREIILIFTRVRISKGVDTNSFNLTVVAPPCYPGKNILNWGRSERKLNM